MLTRLSDKIRRDDRLVGIADDALGVRLGGELDLGLDLLVGGGGLEGEREVYH